MRDDPTNLKWDHEERAWRPEQGLRQWAEEMLAIMFDTSANDDEVDAAATTLVEIVAPARQTVDWLNLAK